MRYYLWDTDVAKLLGAYQTEDEALTLVRALLARYSHAYADDLALGVEFDDQSPGEALRVSFETGGWSFYGAGSR